MNHPDHRLAGSENMSEIRQITSSKWLLSDNQGYAAVPDVY
jgi:hypothetical protein